jgi:hypothetical protein
MSIDRSQYSDNTANSLILTKRCRVLLKKTLGYVTNENRLLLKLGVPNILLNSLSTKEDKLEAETLIEELKQYDKLICEWYALEGPDDSDNGFEAA